MKKTKISPACKALAKKKFKVWPSAYASGFGVRCTRSISHIKCIAKMVMLKKP
jgi:hypothetical protein